MQTPKVYKAMQIIGFLMLCIGLIAAIGVRQSADYGAWEGFATAMAVLLGLALFILGRLLAWWRNG